MEGIVNNIENTSITSFEFKEYIKSLGAKNVDTNNADNEAQHNDKKSEEKPDIVRGVNDLWTSVNHIAIVVSDVGTSLSFYTDVVGMKQVMRPNFDRHGAWLTMNNVDLHLIKGRPAVHADDDLIVSHIALTVTNDKMHELRERLESMDVKFRKNVSVPNPTVASGPNNVTRPVDQAFVRDPDGYYIEFATCESLEDYLKDRMENNESISSKDRWNFMLANGMMRVGKKLSSIGSKAKDEVRKKSTEEDKKINQAPQIEKPEWMVSDDDDDDEGMVTNQNQDMKSSKELANPIKLENLLKRRTVYGDITQNASETQLNRLLVMHDNNVPLVIESLEDWVRVKRTRTYIPPAFYDRDGSFLQPPSFEMPAYVIKDSNSWLGGTPKPQKVENGKQLA